MHSRFVFADQLLSQAWMTIAEVDPSDENSVEAYNDYLYACSKKFISFANDAIPIWLITNKLQVRD